MLLAGAFYIFMKGRTHPRSLFKCQIITYKHARDVQRVHDSARRGQSETQESLFDAKEENWEKGNHQNSDFKEMHAELQFHGHARVCGSHLLY